MKKALGAILLFAGIGLMLYPFLIERQQAKGTESLEQALALIDTGEPANLDELPVSQADLEGTFSLEIPSIGLEQYILPETTEENLNLALTQIKPDQVPGQGNFTIAGHRGWRDGRHFSNLSEVAIGEQVMLHADGQTFVYEITESAVIPPTAVEVLDDQPDVDELTLITCTVSGKDRLAVKGKLVETES